MLREQKNSNLRSLKPMAASAIDMKGVANQIRLLPIHADGFNDNGPRNKSNTPFPSDLKRISITMEISTKETAENKQRGLPTCPLNRDNPT
jgi:hypothetical protein